MKRSLQSLTLLCCLAPAVLAQRWEFGGGAGGGFYTSQDVSSPAGTGSVKITGGLAATAWLANNNSNLWGGELRYDYQMGDLQVSSQSSKATFGSNSHAIHYDFVLHARPRNAKLRPFVSAGGGVKFYRGTGTEVVAQALNGLALLTKTTDLRGMLSLGAGIKLNARRIGLRIEAHDYLTPFPTSVIAPAQNASIGGWVHDFVLNVGVSLLF